jgi:hypothetical protein
MEVSCYFPAKSALQQLSFGPVGRKETGKTLKLVWTQPRQIAGMCRFPSCSPFPFTYHLPMNGGRPSAALSFSLSEEMVKQCTFQVLIPSIFLFIIALQRAMWTSFGQGTILQRTSKFRPKKIYPLVNWISIIWFHEECLNWTVEGSRREYRTELSENKVSSAKREIS